jgi:adenylate kinase
LQKEHAVATSTKYPSILMFGCPGSGKGTQGVVVGQLPNLVHLAMGDIFRGLDKASDIGKEFLTYSSKGQLVPDELTIRVFRHHVDALIEAGKIDLSYHMLILDGIPRTTQQVELLADVIDVKSVIHLMIDDKDALIARLSKRAKTSGRPDDADVKVIENRIEVYERETHPVLEAYPKKLIARVNADQPPLAVLRDIANCLVGVVSARI